MSFTFLQNLITFLWRFLFFLNLRIYWKGTHWCRYCNCVRNLRTSIIRQNSLLIWSIRILSGILFFQYWTSCSIEVSGLSYLSINILVRFLCLSCKLLCPLNIFIWLLTFHYFGSSLVIIDLYFLSFAFDILEYFLCTAWKLF